MLMRRSKRFERTKLAPLSPTARIKIRGLAFD